jgi:Anti-sigma-K factor rskA
VSASDNDRIAYLAGGAVGALTPEERAELDELKGLLEDEAAWAEPAPELEDRVVGVIADEARSRRPLPQRRRGLRLGAILERPIYAGAAIAALVAVAIVVGVIGNNRNGGGPGATKPLRFAMVVSGTALAPDAHGSATLTKTSSGWRINLAATGLPPLSNGRYYQAWVKNAAGILVPVGTFNDAVSVTLWSGVPITQYRTLTVTRQQASGNPASSGQRVLTGTIKPAG